MKKNKSELAKEYFLNGANCAQAVLCAFAEECNLSEESAMRIASGFGGGVGLGAGIGIGDGKNHLEKFKTLLGAQIKAQKIAVFHKKILKSS